MPQPWTPQQIRNLTTPLVYDSALGQMRFDGCRAYSRDGDFYHDLSHMAYENATLWLNGSAKVSERLSRCRDHVPARTGRHGGLRALRLRRLGDARDDRDAVRPGLRPKLPAGARAAGLRLRLPGGLPDQRHLLRQVRAPARRSGTHAAFADWGASRR